MSFRNESPEVTRELAALDAALAGDTVDPDLAELGELVLAIRAERPAPREEFVAELDGRMKAGFRAAETGVRAQNGHSPSKADGIAGPGRARPRRSWRFAPSRQRALPLALGAAASLLIGITAGITSGVLAPEGGDERADPASPGATSFQEQARRSGRAQGASPSAGGGVEVAPGGAPADALTAPGIAPEARERSVARQASLTLSPPRGRVEDVADGVIRITDRYRGFVLSSTVSGGSAGREGATLDLRIPAGRLQTAISDISRLAHVRSRTQSAQDVTAGYTSAQSRLREAIAERRGLLRQLADADTPNETASIRARLRLANRRIARARTALRSIATQVRYAAVGVTVEPGRAQPERSDGWTAGEGLDDALGILGTSVAVALVSLAILVPLALVAALAWVGGRRILRQRRERTLGPAVED